MATAVMTAPAVSKKTKPQDPTPQQIIASARSAPAGFFGSLKVSLLTGILLWASFTPIGFGPLAWVALVPLLLLVKLERPTRWMYQTAYLGGFCCWYATLQWMRLGDPSMYIAWTAFAIYLAFYFPIFVGLTRVAVWKLRLPMLLAAPAIWTGLEYVRAYAFTGFSWYQLGHSQVHWLELIQISDVVGAYGVSFIVAMSSAAFVELVPQRLFSRMKLLPLTVATASPETPGDQIHRWKIAGVLLASVACVVGYGYVRRGQAQFVAGPRVAAIQGNFVASVNGRYAPEKVFLEHRRLTSQAIKQHADVIVWPEVMFPYPYFVKPANVTDAKLKELIPEVDSQNWQDKTELKEMIRSLSQAASAALVLGIETVTADAKGIQLFNSALFVHPQLGLGGRYDKQHRVPFGEYLPLADTLPILGSLTPYRGRYGIQAGQRGAAFEYKGRRFAPVICFEDTVPQVVRQSVRDAIADDPQHRKVDVLLNLTNDGWFHGSSELDQHLITAAFRAVELRTPMVRAVNTGISAIIDGDGAIRARARDSKTGKSKQVEAVVCDFVPLDNRQSWYLQGGDWFSQVCLLLCGVCVVTGCYGRFTKRQPLAAR